MLRWPNRTAQTGVYKTGSPDYIDVSGGAALDERVTFSASATADAWLTDDLVGITIQLVSDPTNYAVWTASWDGVNDYLELYEEEESVGTIPNDAEVSVTACVTEKMLGRGFSTPEIGQFVLVSGTAYTVGAGVAGKTVCCTSSSAVTLTLSPDAPVGFHCLVVQEGSGVVSIQRDGSSSDTVNGGSATVALSDQWKSAYIYQRTEGAWVAVV